MNRILPSILGGSLLAAAGLSAQTAAPTEWGKFRGPNNDGTVSPPLVSDWKRAGIQTLWKADTPKGFSSFAVAGGKAFTLVTGESDGNMGEMIVCLDVKTGKEQWSKPLTIISKYDGGGDAGTKDNKGGDGPRSTPVVDGDKVYAIDANLGVYCFNTATGDLVWNHDVMKDNAGVQIKWQNAASPVIEGNVLMMCGGGAGEALLGFDKNTGKILWKGEDDKMTHATPVVADLLGTRQCIFFTQTGLVSIIPESGKVLWRQPYRFNVSTAASPVVYEDIVYCSAGYGVGAGAYQISKSGSTWSSKELWRKENDDYANHWSTPIVKDGHLYGMFSFKKYGEGPLACVDIRTGEMKWATPGFGPGQVILAGENIIALSDAGELVVVEATPAKYNELKRKEVLDGKVWSYPVLAYNRLFARSTSEGVCVEFR